MRGSFQGGIEDNGGEDVDIAQDRDSGDMDIAEDNEVTIEPVWTCDIVKLGVSNGRTARRMGRFVDKLRTACYSMSKMGPTSVVIVHKGRFRFDKPKVWRKASHGNLWIPEGFTSVVRLSMRYAISLRILRDKGFDCPRYIFFGYDLRGRDLVIFKSTRAKRDIFLTFLDKCGNHFGEKFTQAVDSSINRRDSPFFVFGLKTCAMEHEMYVQELHFCSAKTKPDQTRLAITLIALRKKKKFLPKEDKQVIAYLARFIHNTVL